MTDAPERIWAVPEYNCTVYMSGNSPITAQNGPFTHHRHGAATAYIRADLVEAMQVENQRLREALEQIAAQKRTDELVTALDVEFADFEVCYDLCIDRAREALAPTDTPRS